MRGSRRALAGGAVLLAAIAALPVVAVVARGIAPGAGDTWSHLASTLLPTYVANTLALFMLVGVGAGVGGTVTAWLIAHRRFPGSRLFDWALLLPLAMPTYVMAYAYTDFLQFAGPLQGWLRATLGWSRGDYWFPDVRTLGGAATMFVFSLYPYVYLLARTAFLERPPTLVEAAHTLGLSRASAFWRVELPLARPAIAGGIALALMETLADYGTVAYFAIDTFTTGIYRAWFSLGDRAAAAQLATSLLGFVVAAVAIERHSRRFTRVAGGTRSRSDPPVRPRLEGVRAWLAAALCAIALGVGFVIPVVLLLRLLLANEAIDMSRFAWWAWNSVRVAALGSAIAVAAAVLIAYASRLAPGVLTRSTAQLLNLGYAVPGTVLAVGVLLPLGTLDNAIAEALRSAFGVNPGLLLTGSVVALLYAYLVRYFAVASNGIEPGFARITPAMDAAARSLGTGTFEMLLRVHGPLLARSLAAAFLLVFVDVMKELPATLVLRPFNFDTLATQTYQFARDERLPEAALPSLAIVLVGLLPIVLLARSARRSAATTRAMAPAV
ncbi:MAG TPA: iron ABC transporter permease [Casimicrobiaceae bacterium]|nr:iron ABC transporter permease [Casimicrobiaceae bacterium]